MSAPCEPHLLSPRGGVPNNQRLPILIYRGALLADSDNLADRFEVLFERNGWPAQWRDGVYPFHHYHSTAHEVLGVAAGAAGLTLGGEGGLEIGLDAGDALVLPAGTGHCRRWASSDFLVVGGYPRGQSWDTCRAPADRETLARIRAVPDPGSDPVVGRRVPS